MDCVYGFESVDRAGPKVLSRDPVSDRHSKNQPVLFVYLMALLLLLFLPCRAIAGHSVAESNVIPDRIVQSNGGFNYNYNVHEITIETGESSQTIYRYNVYRFDRMPTAKDVEAVIDASTLYTKDGISLGGQAPLCDQTGEPSWANPGRVEKVKAVEQ